MNKIILDAPGIDPFRDQRTGVRQVRENFFWNFGFDEQPVTLRQKFEDRQRSRRVAESVCADVIGDALDGSPVSRDLGLVI